MPFLDLDLLDNEHLRSQFYYMCLINHKLARKVKKRIVWNEFAMICTLGEPSNQTRVVGSSRC